MSSSELFLSGNDPKRIEFEFRLRPTLDFSNGCQFPISKGLGLHVDQEQEEDHHQQQKQQKEEEDQAKKEEKSSDQELKKLSLGEFKVDEDDDDDDDGYRTPTSLDHRIPVIKQCPPAPRKPKPPKSSKRKSSSSEIRKQLGLDLSKEIESLFPPELLADISRKIKKARGDDTN